MTGKSRNFCAFDRKRNWEIAFKSSFVVQLRGVSILHVVALSFGIIIHIRNSRFHHQCLWSLRRFSTLHQVLANVEFGTIFGRQLMSQFILIFRSKCERTTTQHSEGKEI